MVNKLKMEQKLVEQELSCLMEITIRLEDELNSIVCSDEE